MLIYHWINDLISDLYLLNFVVSIVSADGLASYDARPSAGTVMTI